MCCCHRTWPTDREVLRGTRRTSSRTHLCCQDPGASRFPIVMWRSCWPSGACAPITSRCGDGYSVTPRRWNYVCAVVSNRPATVGGSTRPTSGSRVSGCIYTALWTDSTGATIDFLLWAKRDAAAAERFLAKALSGATHPAPRVINTDKHAGYPPAIVQLKSEAALERNCRHR